VASPVGLPQVCRNDTPSCRKRALCKRALAPYTGNHGNARDQGATLKILILHLSDVHFKSQNNPIVERRGRIVEAVRNLEFALDRAILVISGDIAHSGAEAEYLVALDFVESLCTELKREFRQTDDVPCIVVPGNHDCDFSKASSLRDMVLESLSADPTKTRDPSVVEVCTGVQDEFFQFLDAVGQPFLQRKGRLGYTYTVDVAGETVLFRCYNTALTSRLEERAGTLICGLAGNDKTTGPSLVVSVLHHPYNWLAPPNGRALRKEIEQTSDLVLTGHEHEHTRRVQHVATGEVNEYIEGAVLQENENPDSSAFNVILIDVSNGKQKFFHFLWHDGMYAPSSTKVEWEPLQINRLRTRRLFEPTEGMQHFLDDPGLTLTQRDKGQLSLPDIYVSPDLREVSFKGEQTSLLHGDALVDRIVALGTVLITGSEQSGKTTLAKRLFVEFRRKGYVPLYVDCSSVKLESPDQTYHLFHRLVEDQYGADDVEPYKQADRQKRVLILDNLHRLAATRTMRRQLLEILSQFSGYAVLFAHDLALQINEIAHNASVPFKRYKIQQFGHLLRNRLVEKWFLLGDEHREDASFVHALTHVERVLDTILGKNFVPAYPVFILSILQANETATPIDLRASTQGYFYEMFIRAALGVGENRQSYDVKSAYLAFLAYHFFVNKWRSAALEELARIHEAYQNTYDIKRSMKDLLDQLLKRRILEEREGRLTFKYRYIYYYFVASYLRDHITEPSTRNVVSGLAQRVYVEENANILLFLAHLSRDPFIIDEMLREAGRVYDAWPQAKLEEDAAFVADLMTSQIKLEYVEKDTETARREMLAQLDARTSREPVQEEIIDPNVEPDAALLDPVMHLNIALKTQQILGQILKNFPGSLEGDTKLRIAGQCYGLGLRALAAILDLIRQHKTALVEDIRSFLAKETAEQDVERLSEKARHTLGGMAHLIAFGLIKRVSHAVGSPDLTETYERILGSKPTIALQLIDTSIKLDHSAALPESEIGGLVERVARAPFSMSILQHLVVQRFYLFPADYKVRQRICELLGIAYKPIQVMDPRQKLIGPGKD